MVYNACWLMLVHRLRLWSNIESTLGERVVLAGRPPVQACQGNQEEIPTSRSVSWDETEIRSNRLPDNLRYPHSQSHGGEEPSTCNRRRPAGTIDNALQSLQPLATATVLLKVTSPFLLSSFFYSAFFFVCRSITCGNNENTLQSLASATSFL